MFCCQRIVSLSHFLTSLSQRVEEGNFMVLLLPISFRIKFVSGLTYFPGVFKALVGQTCSFRGPSLLPTFSGVDPPELNRNILLQLSSMSLSRKLLHTTPCKALGAGGGGGTTKLNQHLLVQGVCNRPGTVKTRLLMVTTSSQTA